MNSLHKYKSNNIDVQLILVSNIFVQNQHHKYYITWTLKNYSRKPFFELAEERFIKYLDWWWKFDLSSGTYFFHKQTSSTKTSDFISSFPWMKECQHPFSKAPKKKNNLFDIQQRKRKKYQMVLILKEMKVAILKQ